MEDGRSAIEMGFPSFRNFVPAIFPRLQLENKERENIVEKNAKCALFLGLCDKTFLLRQHKNIITQGLSGS